jgi:hypothetical protein
MVGKGILMVLITVGFGNDGAGGYIDHRPVGNPKRKV